MPRRIFSNRWFDALSEVTTAVIQEVCIHRQLKCIERLSAAIFVS